MALHVTVKQLQSWPFKIGHKHFLLIHCYLFFYFYLLSNKNQRGKFHSMTSKTLCISLTSALYFYKNEFWVPHTAPNLEVQGHLFWVALILDELSLATRQPNLPSFSVGIYPLPKLPLWDTETLLLSPLLCHSILHCTAFATRMWGDKVCWKSYNWWRFTGHAHVRAHTHRNPTTSHLVLHNLTCWYIIKTAYHTVTNIKLLRPKVVNIGSISSTSITWATLLLFQDHWTIFVILCVVLNCI